MADEHAERKARALEILDAIIEPAIRDDWRGVLALRADARDIVSTL